MDLVFTDRADVVWKCYWVIYTGDLFLLKYRFWVLCTVCHRITVRMIWITMAGFLDLVILYSNVSLEGLYWIPNQILNPMSRFPSQQHLPKLKNPRISSSVHLKKSNLMIFSRYIFLLISNFSSITINSILNQILARAVKLSVKRYIIRLLRNDQSNHWFLISLLGWELTKNVSDWCIKES